jgi:polyhydroxyalkanoate synthesis regulator phasin
MKSLIIKSIYAGLGLLDSGKKSVEHLGRELARQADLSEKDGEKIARNLHARADKAITTVHGVVQSEIKKAVDTLRAATQAEIHHASSQQRKTASPHRPARKPRKRAASKRST